MTFKNFGKQVETIWNDLRPVTREMLVKALKSNTKKQTISYDAHADWELSKLLNALDEEVREKNPKKAETKEMRNMADLCANVLESQTESAEVFIQLAQRALARNNFKKIDALSDVLFERFTSGEIAEVIRQTNMPQIKAIAYETLVVLPVSLIIPLLDDPLYFEIACNALEQQAVEFESDEARSVLEELDYLGERKWQ